MPDLLLNLDGTTSKIDRSILIKCLNPKVANAFPNAEAGDETWTTKVVGSTEIGFVLLRQGRVVEVIAPSPIPAPTIPPIVAPAQLLPDKFLAKTETVATGKS